MHSEWKFSLNMKNHILIAFHNVVGLQDFFNLQSPLILKSTLVYFSNYRRVFTHNKFRNNFFNPAMDTLAYAANTEI